MSFTIAPPVSTPVLYYNGADKSKPPVAATVLETNDRGILRLSVFPRAGGDMIGRHSVYHISHPGFRDHKGEFTPAANNGAWDYHPWFMPPQEEIDARYKAVSEEADKESKVIELANEFSFDQVCRKVRNLGLSASDVEKIYKKHGHPLPQTASV